MTAVLSEALLLAIPTRAINTSSLCFIMFLRETRGQYDILPHPVYAIPSKRVKLT
jgi:hypothetical protein